MRPLPPLPMLARTAALPQCERAPHDAHRMQAAAEEEEKGIGPIPLKYVVLVLLVLQNSLTAILARASRVPATPQTQLYLGSVAVFAAEVIKLPVCLALIIRDEGGVIKMLRAVWDGVQGAELAPAPRPKTAAWPSELRIGAVVR